MVTDLPTLLDDLRAAWRESSVGLPVLATPSGETIASILRQGEEWRCGTRPANVAKTGGETLRRARKT